MSTDIVEWALENRTYLESAYELFADLGLDHDLILERLLLPAVMAAYSNCDSRAKGRRKAENENRKIRTSFPAPGQVLQLAVLRALRGVDRMQSQVPGWYLARHLSSLVSFTVYDSAFSVVTGIGFSRFPMIEPTMIQSRIRPMAPKIM